MRVHPQPPPAGDNKPDTVADCSNVLRFPIKSGEVSAPKLRGTEVNLKETLRCAQSDAHRDSA